MIHVRGLLLLSLALITLPSCHALLPPHPLPRNTGRQHAVRSTNVRQIASWRGGAVASGGGQSPKMNVQLGLVRVAGYGIIAGSLGLKTPQITRVWRAKSLVGLAPASIYADVFLFATSVIYHVLKRNPIRAYGEGDAEGVLAAQASARKTRPAGGGPLGRTAIVLGSLAASAACMLYLPERMWGLLVVVSTPAILMVQLPQIWKNSRQKHTGELATLTVLLAFCGSSVRIATTIADLGGDPWLLLNYVLGAASNAAMLTQIYIYRARTEIVRRKVQKKGNGASAAA